MNDKQLKILTLTLLFIAFILFIVGTILSFNNTIDTSTSFIMNGGGWLFLLFGWIGIYIRHKRTKKNSS